MARSRNERTARHALPRRLFVTCISLVTATAPKASRCSLKSDTGSPRSKCPLRSRPSTWIRPHPVVIACLRHLPVTRTQLPHRNVAVRPQRPARIQLLAPKLLASCRLVGGKLRRNGGTGVVGDSCVLCVDFSPCRAEVVCWLVGAGGC